MPELTFLKLNESHDALEFEFYSPEEMQAYLKALPTEIPAGSQLVVKRGVKHRGKGISRPTLTVGIQRIGEASTLPAPGTGEVVPPAAVPAALTIPQTVKDASNETLEVMAAKNGVEVTLAWKAKNRAFREASVAKAMKDKRTAVPA